MSKQGRAVVVRGLVAGLALLGAVQALPGTVPAQAQADAPANDLPTGFTDGIPVGGANGPEEQAEQGRFDGEQGYKAALLSTLKRTRELLAEGLL